MRKNPDQAVEFWAAQRRAQAPGFWQLVQPEHSQERDLTIPKHIPLRINTNIEMQKKMTFGELYLNQSLASLS